MARVCGGAAAAAAAARLISALASAELGIDHAYASADGPFNFSPFSSSSSAPPQASPESLANADQPPRVRNNNPRTTSAGFDPEALERGAKAVREINSSSHAKKVCNLGNFLN